MSPYLYHIRVSQTKETPLSGCILCFLPAGTSCAASNQGTENRRKGRSGSCCDTMLSLFLASNLLLESNGSKLLIWQKFQKIAEERNEYEHKV